MRTWILVSTLLLSLASYGAWAQDVEPPMQEAPTQAPAMEPPVQDTPAAPAPSMEPPQQEPTPPPASTPQTTPPPVETPEEILAKPGEKIPLERAESIISKIDRKTNQLVVERKNMNPKPGVWRDEVLYRGRAPQTAAERRRVVHTQILPALERGGISQTAILRILEPRLRALKEELRNEFQTAITEERDARKRADNNLNTRIEELAGKVKTLSDLRTTELVERQGGNLPSEKTKIPRAWLFIPVLIGLALFAIWHKRPVWITSQVAYDWIAVGAATCVIITIAWFIWMVAAGR